MARRRAQWAARQRLVDPARLVFIDETWTKTNMAPLRGWSPRGERLPAKVPHGHWRTMTFLAALRHDRVEAPWLLDGPINGETFRLYVDKVLVPTLRQGDIVVMDNLGSHKSKAVRRAIRAAGARLLFLPKYSPDLNPIEQLFSKLKLAKLRWRIERDYQELKQELGLGHFEGRGWRGFHHHATLCIAAYAFLVAERARFPLRTDASPRGDFSSRRSDPEIARRSDRSVTSRTQSPPCAEP